MSCTAYINNTNMAITRKNNKRGQNHYKSGHANTVAMWELVYSSMRDWLCKVSVSFKGDNDTHATFGCVVFSQSYAYSYTNSFITSCNFLEVQNNLLNWQTYMYVKFKAQFKIVCLWSSATVFWNNGGPQKRRDFAFLYQILWQQCPT